MFPGRPLLKRWPSPWPCILAPAPQVGADPKGAAFLWAAPTLQPRLLPVVTSHGYGLVGGHSPWLPQEHRSLFEALRRSAAARCAASNCLRPPARLLTSTGLPGRVPVERHIRLHGHHGGSHGWGGQRRQPAGGAAPSCLRRPLRFATWRSHQRPTHSNAPLPPACPCSAALAVMAVLEPAASEYRCSLLRQAVALLLRAWGTQAALGVQAEGAVMSAVELPPFRCAAGLCAASALAD